MVIGQSLALSKVCDVSVSSLSRCMIGNAFGWSVLAVDCLFLALPLSINPSVLAVLKYLSA